MWRALALAAAVGTSANLWAQPPTMLPSPRAGAPSPNVTRVPNETTQGAPALALPPPPPSALPEEPAPPAPAAALPQRFAPPKPEPIVPASIVEPSRNLWADIGTCCDQCLYECLGSSSLSAGAGFYYVKPHFDNNPGFASFSAASGGTAQFGTDFSYDYSFSPVLWIGVANEGGLGLRARWFHFQQSSDPLLASTADSAGATHIRSAAPLGLGLDSSSTVLNGANRIGAADFAFETSLEVDVWDFEGSQALDFGYWTMLFSGGLRYAHLAQSYNAFLLVHASTVNGNRFGESGGAFSGHSFNGAGPTIALDVTRKLGDSGFAVFASARGAILFGRSKQGAFRNLLATRTTPSGTTVRDGPTTNDSAYVTHEQTLPVTELEVGLNWARDVGRTNVFFQSAFVGHNWWGAGNGANNDLIGASGGRTDEISDSKSSLGLLGLKIVAGIRY